MTATRHPNRWAYFGVPHTGGTYSVFRALRKGLENADVELRWIGVGRDDSRLASRPEWAADGRFGEVVASELEDDKAQAAALIEHLQKGGYTGVFVNVLASRVQTNAVRYLTESIRRVMIVHNVTPGTYAAARAMRGFVHSTVAVSPRIKRDLVSRHGFQSSRIHTIPNGIDLSRFAAATRAAPVNRLRVLVLGRVEEISKGVFWIPAILDKIGGAQVEVTIAGDGPDLGELRRRLAGLIPDVRFFGRVAPEQVPQLCADHDVLLFPSRFEGLGIVLVEAMAAGCVPVTSHIRGVTDFVVEDGKSGLLFPIGVTATAAAQLCELAENRVRLGDLSREAQARSLDFGIDHMAARYADLMASVTASPCNISPALRISEWRYPAGLRPGLRTFLPEPVKNVLRRLRERVLA